MDSEIRTVVTFNSTAFNMAEPKDYFINPCCYGDDLAIWLIGELRKQGVKTDEKPGQEDFGWYLNFDVTGIGHTFVIGHRPEGESDAGTWIGWVERNRGFFGSILRGRKRGIRPSAVAAVHGILSSSPLIRDARWHFERDFDKGNEERGASSPQTPSRALGITSIHFQSVGQLRNELAALPFAILPSISEVSLSNVSTIGMK